MSKQVQLRGGTKDEHRQFIGANREVTVDTSKNTLRVHDGHTYGGTVLATEDMVNANINNTIEYIDRVVNDISEIHDHDDLYSKLDHRHDDLYSKLDHRHDDLYERKISGLAPAKFKALNGYYGISDPDGYDDVWIRTTRNGLIPYQSGGYSSIGTSSWRFNDGWFNNINTKTITVAKNGYSSSIYFPAQTNDPGYIQHWENNNTAYMNFSVSDDRCDGDRFYFGSTPGGNYRAGAYLTSDGKLRIDRYLDMGQNLIMFNDGKRVYFDGSRPSDAPDGSISFG